MMSDKERREYNKCIYEILMNPNLMFAVKEQRLRDLVDKVFEDGYTKGSKDTDIVYEKLFNNNEFDNLW